MTEHINKTEAISRQQEWLAGLRREHQQACRAAEDAFRAAELAGGQAALQELFVDTLELVQLSPDATIRNKGVPGTYDGVAAVLEVVSPIEGNEDKHYLNTEDSVRFMVYEAMPEGDGNLITDVAVSRRKDSPSWFAETGMYHASTSRKGGNPGVSWVKSSGLVDGGNAQPLGLAPEVHNVCNMIKSVLDQRKQQ